MSYQGKIIGIAAKYLSAVEVDPLKSHQHEFNAVSQLKKIIGTEKKEFRAQYLYLDDKENFIEENGVLTWYDARENHATRTEHRIYYKKNHAIEKAQEGDLIVFLVLPANEMLVVIAPSGSTVESQLTWLFNIENVKNSLIVRSFEETRFLEAQFAGRMILEKLGFEDELQLESFEKGLLQRFKSHFPSTKEMASFIQENFGNNFNPINEIDTLILHLLEKEEAAFKVLEKIEVEKRLEKGFKDVEDFISYSLSVQNRRKSRAGHAFENHIEYIFIKNNIKYDRGKITENRSKPDFIFPSIQEYNSPIFSDKKLFMLAAKTTAKDRWRQILSEAKRIKYKHLATLEPAISTYQLDEMNYNNIVPVVPEKIRVTYPLNKKELHISFFDFVRIIKSKQE